MQYTLYLLLRYDGGLNADDVPSNLPPNQLQDLALNFYRSNIMINSDKIQQIQLLTSNQADDEAASGIWKSERRLRITSSNVKIIAQRRPTTPSAPTVSNYCTAALQEMQQQDMA